MNYSKLVLVSALAFALPVFAQNTVANVTTTTPEKGVIKADKAALHEDKAAHKEAVKAGQTDEAVKTKAEVKTDKEQLKTDKTKLHADHKAKIEAKKVATPETTAPVTAQ